MGDWGLLSSVTYPGVFARSRGHTCSTLERFRWHPSWWLVSRGDSSFTPPVGSGALRIRKKLTRPGSTSRTRVRHFWRPRHVLQASNIVVVAATLLCNGSIRHQSSGLQTHCLLLLCACRFPRTARNRNTRRQCQVFVFRPRPLEVCWRLNGSERAGHHIEMKKGGTRMVKLCKSQIVLEDTLREAARSTNT